MDSSQLKPEQRARLRADLEHQLGYLNKLCARMQMLRFPDDDPVWREAQTARSRMQTLYDAARFAGRAGV
jgi:hypothetical protein